MASWDRNSARAKAYRVAGPGLLAAVFLGSCSPDDTPKEFAPVVIGLTDAEAVLELQLRGADLRAKRLHLTFDDGPGLRTEELAAYLRDLDIPATFFINGVNVPGRESTVRAVARDGYHALGNHGQNHLLLTRGLSAAQAMDEVKRTSDIARAYAPAGPFYFRPPFQGMTSALYTQLFSDASMKLVGPIHWDIGDELAKDRAADWQCWATGTTVEACADLYYAEIDKKKGGIVLLHDSRSKTVDLVKVLVPRLLANGYHFVPLREVPTVKRAIDEGMPVPVKGQCFSGTTFQLVANGGCVQSTANQRWYQCRQSEWTFFDGALADCAVQLPLQN